MRALADEARIRRFMRETGAAASGEGLAYLTGGATAVLYGWRGATLDIDVRFVPEDESVLRALPRLKDELSVNVELVSPADFVPVPEGWEDRSVFVAQEGRLSFFHFDPYSQALAKLERAHARDLEDVDALISAGLVEPTRLGAAFEAIEPELFRFPAVDPGAFRRRVQDAVARQ